MPIATGDKLPEATLRVLGEDGPEEVSFPDRTVGRKVLVIGMPGAFTGTCTMTHMPGLVANADAFRAKGVDEIIVTVVNDVQVAKSWAEHTGAKAAGITVLADPTGEYAKALGHTFDAPPMGFYGRHMRHLMVVEDGTVTRFVLEEGRGTCDMTGGAAVLDLLWAPGSVPVTGSD